MPLSPDDPLRRAVNNSLLAGMADMKELVAKSTTAPSFEVWNELQERGEREIGLDTERITSALLYALHKFRSAEGRVVTEDEELELVPLLASIFWAGIVYMKERDIP